MPTAYIKKLAKEGHGTVQSLEKKWDEAKAAAKKEGKGENFAYVTGIFQKMLGAHVFNEGAVLEAKARLQASYHAAFLSTGGAGYK